MLSDFLKGSKENSIFFGRQICSVIWRVGGVGGEGGGKYPKDRIKKYRLEDVKQKDTQIFFFFIDAEQTILEKILLLVAWYLNKPE